MIIGDPSSFAIESEITQAYERLSFRALGFFVLHIGCHSYGVRESDATMLACAFDEVQRRIQYRGQHIAPFANEPDAGKIADAFGFAIYAPDQEKKRFFGIPQPTFIKLGNTNKLLWTGNDEEFDDGSALIQFNVDNRVRLIGYKSMDEGYRHDPETLTDIWLDADEYYGVLQRWHDAFEAEWTLAKKISQADDGADKF